MKVTRAGVCEVVGMGVAQVVMVAVDTVDCLCGWWISCRHYRDESEQEQDT